MDLHSSKICRRPLAACAILLIIGISFSTRRPAHVYLAAGDDATQQKVVPPHFTAEEFLEPIKFLASEGLQGRGDGTPSLDMAADYIADQFRRAELKPLGDAHTYLQRFSITMAPRLSAYNSLALETGGEKKYFRFGHDFIPLSFSESVTLSAPLVFVGYGITAPEFHYDDYAGVDVKGKIVLMLRHKPQEHDEESVFGGRGFNRHADIAHKAINARDHGAAGMILVNDAGNHPGEPDELIPFGAVDGPEKMRIPVLQMTTERADYWLRASGHTLDDLRQAIDKDLSNHSFAVDPLIQAQIRTEIMRFQRQVANVIGEIPGSDRGAGCIVIGAHYDHLGRGNPYELAAGHLGQVHYGADDNASGVSGVLELARELAGRPQRPVHSLVFIAFAGKEAHLVGSRYYATHPAWPPEQTLAMLNMDMIGRVTKNRLYVGGTATSTSFPKMVQEANRSIGLDLDYSPSGYGASDHISFTDRGVPVLFFFSGLHPDYQKPSDTWEKINALDGARAVELADNVVKLLDGLKRKPQFVRVAEPSSLMDGSAGGDIPCFGAIFDFAEVGRGVQLAYVGGGTPAAKAGFKGGDILVQFGEKTIENLYDFTYALGDRKPGDKVSVTVLRDSQSLTREVALTVRN